MPRKDDSREGRQLTLLKGKTTHKQGGPRVTGQGGYCNYLKADKVNRCRNKAGLGTDHPGFGACLVHGGMTEAHKKGAARMQIAEMAQELQVDPVTALLSTVHMTAGMVAWLRNQIGTLEALVTDPDSDEEVRLRIDSLAALYGDERERLAKFSKMAIDAGIAERQVQIAEAEAAVLVMAIKGVLDGLNLDPTQKALAPKLIRTHLLAIPVSSSAS